MKRRDLLGHLTAHGCRFDREGGRHSVWVNPRTGHRAPVPRHTEVDDHTARKVCKQLGVPPP